MVTYNIRGGGTQVLSVTLQFDNTIHNKYMHYNKLLTGITFKTHFIILPLTSDENGIIFCITRVFWGVFHVDAKLVMWSSCQPVDFIQSQPEFTCEIPKTMFVILPSSVEINASIKTTLKHSPSSPGCCHITDDIETALTVRINSINSILRYPLFV